MQDGLVCLKLGNAIRMLPLGRRPLGIGAVNRSQIPQPCRPVPRRRDQQIWIVVRFLNGFHSTGVPHKTSTAHVLFQVPNPYRLIARRRHEMLVVAAPCHVKNGIFVAHEVVHDTTVGGDVGGAFVRVEFS